MAERERDGFIFCLITSKRDCPGRPLISGCNTPTAKISAFVDHHLKPLAAAAPSYVKDTNEFLKKLRDISTLPIGAIMVTLDVVELYPHIPGEEVLKSVREALNNRENSRTCRPGRVSA